MTKLLVIGLGGFFGAVARWSLSGWVQMRTGGDFPAGTLAVNVVGCFLLGALMAFVESRPALGPETRAFLAVGILGSFTTFSTFGYETLELARIGAMRTAFLSVAANLVVGLAAVAAGRAGVRLFAG